MRCGFRSATVLRFCLSIRVVLNATLIDSSLIFHSLHFGACREDSWLILSSSPEVGVLETQNLTCVFRTSPHISVCAGPACIKPHIPVLRRTIHPHYQPCNNRSSQSLKPSNSHQQRPLLVILAVQTYRWKKNTKIINQRVLIHIYSLYVGV